VSNGYNLLGILQNYAPNGDAQKSCTEMYWKLCRSGMTDEEIDLAMAGAIVDGLRHGNWPWRSPMEEI
jgi:hypothetical protein